MYLHYSAAITLRIRPLAPDGMVLYVADNFVSPKQWLSLYLSNGYLTFAIQTDTMTESVITSNYQYVTGDWWTVTLLRLQNFIAMVSFWSG